MQVQNTGGVRELRVDRGVRSDRGCLRRPGPWRDCLCSGSTAARAQYPSPHILNLNERSGLVMRFQGNEASLPPDPLRDNFYQTRYADRGLVKHLDGIKDQGLYGLGWKAAHRERLPLFWGSPGTER